jgi:hypothetical protein
MHFSKSLTCTLRICEFYKLCLNKTDYEKKQIDISQLSDFDESASGSDGDSTKNNALALPSVFISMRWQSDTMSLC